MMNGLVERFAMMSGDVLALQLRAAGLLAIAMLVAYLVRRRSASVRHRVWAFGLASVVALPLVTPWLPLFELRGAGEAVPRGVAAQPEPSERAIDVARLGDGEAEIGAAAAGAAQTISSGWWVAAWLGGPALIGGRTLVGMRGLASLRRRARAPGPRLSRRLAAIEPRVDLPVWISDDVATPMVGGVLRPVVLLPAAFESSAADRLQLVLAHELGHVRQGDHRWVLVAALARAMCWPNPLVWLASSPLRRTAEWAADDAVLATGVRPSTYAAELLAYARELGKRRSPALAVSIVGRSSLATRIGALLRDDQRRGAAALTFVIPLAIGSLGTAASFAMLHVCEESRTPVSATAEAPALAVEAHPPAVMARVRIGLDRLEMTDDTSRTSASVPLERGRFGAGALQGHLVTALHEEFASTTMQVQADDAVPFGTVVDVLYTAGRGGVRSWVFGWNDRELAANPPRFEADAPTRPDDLRVRWTADEIVLERVAADPTRPREPGCIAMPREPRAASFVATVAADVCEQCTAAGCPALRIAPAADTPYAEAMAIAVAITDATRSCNAELVVESGDSSGASCEQPDIAAFVP
ncbi:MAG TPA: M56 family metallopeptidase [Nannocystaceae bacterium]|nr:M56 family metallopeptidase [Nannocystaceae bacterium]